MEGKGLGGVKKWGGSVDVCKSIEKVELMCA